jgi:TonB family protein
MTGILEIWVQVSQLFQAVSGWGLTILLEAFVKGTILLLFAGALALALRRASAATRHLVWTLALGSVLALPLFGLILPAWNVPMFSSFPYAGENAQRRGREDFPASQLDSQFALSSEDQAPASRPWAGWVLLSWAIGSTLFMARMAVGEIRVRRLASRSQPFRADLANSVLENGSRSLRIAHPVGLRVSPEIDVPFTRGIFHPAIFLPEQAMQWQREELEFVLAHELAHVCRHDCLTQIPAQVACALFWFHPLVWLAAFQMRKERERACDDMVLNLGHPAADYAEFLVMLGRSLRRLTAAWSTSIAMAQSSQLEVRMKALLDANMNHKPLAARRALFGVLLTFALLLPAAAIHATAKNEMAKDEKGSISGTVREPSKGGVPSASVDLINLTTLKKISITTSEDGSFEFSDIPVGAYRLEIAKTGFTATNTQPFELLPSRNIIVVVVIRHSAAGAPPGPGHAEGGTPQRIRIGGPVEEKKLVYSPSPQYPPLAKMAGIEGTVKLDATIAEDGKVKDLRVISGHPLLVKAALDAVKNWRYRATLLNGDPVEVETTVTVNFTLAQQSR